MLKKAFLFLCCLAICRSGQAAGHPARIIIQLSGYNPKVHKQYAEITLADASAPITEQVKISNSGKIEHVFLLSGIRELVLSYEGKDISLIASPNDQIQLAFNMSALTHQYAAPVKARVSGIHKTTNALILEHAYLVRKWIESSHSAFSADKLLTESGYRILRSKDMQDQLNTLEKFIAERDIRDPYFKQWAEANIRYAAGKDFCIFPFMGRINKSISEKDSYFDFIKELTPVDSFSYATHSYGEYLRLLADAFEIISNISAAHTERRQALKSEGASVFPIVFDILTRKTDGAQRVATLTYMYQKTPKIPPAYMDSLSRYLPDIQSIPKNGSAEAPSQTVLEWLRHYDIPEADKRPLIELYEGAAGKLIVHDFWFTNCAPCMSELPHYNALIDQSGPDVEYLFFGAYMKEKEWQDAIKKHGLKGKHHLLTKNQIAFYERYFGLKGYPHHALVNRKGFLSNRRISGPRPENIKNILSELEAVKD